MRRFIQRALEKLDKLDRGSIRNLVLDIASDNERLEMDSIPAWCLNNERVIWSSQQGTLAKLNRACVC